MENDPLRHGDNDVLCLVQGGQLGLDGVVGVCHVLARDLKASRCRLFYLVLWVPADLDVGAPRVPDDFCLSCTTVKMMNTSRNCDGNVVVCVSDMGKGEVACPLSHEAASLGALAPHSGSSSGPGS